MDSPAGPAGWLGGLRAGLARTRQALTARVDDLLGRGTGEQFYEDLEETLIQADLSVPTAAAAIARLRERARGGARTPEALRRALVEILADALGRPAPLVVGPSPAVILVLGTNGSGKTTTIGKLAARLKGEGRKVLLVAADTFRAAAIEQLGVWAARAGVDLIRHQPGADPAAVAFDAAQAARARHVDVLIVDTAGRLHTKANLMEELKKVDRVLRRELPGAPVEALLVLDATTGQNGIAQARQFKAALPVTGIVLTKLDGTARGGVVVAIAEDLGLPVKLVGFGEGPDDLQPFDPRTFAEALFAADAK
ncbi:MAG: signal recognition particle-docking protein FtsY [Bacillati bacterium ANGP1]|uniref:Signal recognition particle receptor FtsY n=1 Tax=Candidatus Segetimicrobium genomatis TaxID=2569760 RepID=A0A537JBP3_9BACT|nr:MAG: signal recognition particle-docking protein FtsY [Terrabacteria group bacterium ANGP1]